MALSPEVRLRIRVTLYIIFIILYASGVYVFAKHFHNFLAAVGFSAAVVFLLSAVVLHLIPDETLFLALPPGSLARVMLQSGVLFLFSGFVSGALYALVEGIMLRQSWNGESYFCSFIALLTAAKWCLYCGYRIANLRCADSGCDTDEEEEEAEEKNVFESTMMKQDNSKSKEAFS